MLIRRFAVLVVAAGILAGCGGSTPSSLAWGVLPATQFASCDSAWLHVKLPSQHLNLDTLASQILAQTDTAAYARFDSAMQNAINSVRAVTKSTPNWQQRITAAWTPAAKACKALVKVATTT